MAMSRSAPWAVVGVWSVCADASVSGAPLTRRRQGKETESAGARGALRGAQAAWSLSPSPSRRPTPLAQRRQAEFVNDEQQRWLEIEDMRLVVKFGEKKRYSDQECQAIYQELIAAGLDEEARRNPDAIEAVFRELNAVDEAAAARCYFSG